MEVRIYKPGNTFHGARLCSIGCGIEWSVPHGLDLFLDDIYLQTFGTNISFHVEGEYHDRPGEWSKSVHRFRHTDWVPDEHKDKEKGPCQHHKRTNTQMGFEYCLGCDVKFRFINFNWVEVKS